MNALRQILSDVFKCLYAMFRTVLFALIHKDEESSVKELARNMVTSARRNKMARICIRYPFRSHDLCTNRHGLMDRLQQEIIAAGGDPTHMGYFGARKIYLNTIPAWLYDVSRLSTQYQVETSGSSEDSETAEQAAVSSTHE